MVAYHYPPEGMSSGVLRTLKFSKYLPDHGWTPHVLTLKESFYPVRDDGLLKEIRPEVVVHRTPGLDSSRHLAINGHYLSALSVPDCAVSWLPFGFARGLRVIKNEGIHALYSTSPQPTAHLIAASLRVVTKLPWIADFRDPWIEAGAHPRPRSVRYRVEAALESLVMHRASRITVTTDPFRCEILARYPDLSPEHVTVIFNGFDEADFTTLRELGRHDRFEVLHAGLVTPDYRDPFPFLRAAKACLDRRTLRRDDLRITFQGAGSYVSSPVFSARVQELGLGDLVRVVGRLQYRESLQRIMDATILLLIQASDDTRTLIPAKAFEYLRAGRPILALTYEGATADLVRQARAGVVADPRTPPALEAAIETLYRRWRTGSSSRGADPHLIRRFERATLTSQLAASLDSVTGHALVD